MSVSFLDGLLQIERSPPGRLIGIPMRIALSSPDGPEVEEERNSHPSVLSGVAGSQLLVGAYFSDRLDRHSAGLQCPAVGLQRAMLAMESHLDAAPIDRRRHRRRAHVGASNHEGCSGVPTLERPCRVEWVDDGHAK